MWCTSRYNTRVIPFRVSFEPGISLYEQVVYAAKKGSGFWSDARR